MVRTDFYHNHTSFVHFLCDHTPSWICKLCLLLLWTKWGKSQPLSRNWKIFVQDSRNPRSTNKLDFLLYSYHSINLVFKMSSKVQVKGDIYAAEIRVNVIVTSSHICVIGVHCNSSSIDILQKFDSELSNGICLRVLRGTSWDIFISDAIVYFWQPEAAKYICWRRPCLCNDLNFLRKTLGH